MPRTPANFSIITLARLPPDPRRGLGSPALRKLQSARQSRQHARHRRRQPRSGRFADPDRLDVGRQPNRHLAFGSGPHVCAGLNVARLEGRIPIGRFLARFPNYALSGTPPAAAAPPFRGFTSIPVILN